MQITRERILNILKERDQVTVDELSQELSLTTVTVRHHLDILRGERLVAAPIVHRRKSPGRPQYIYALTEKASTFFPKRYDHLTNLILREARSRLSPDEMNQMMKRIGEHIASQAVLPGEGDFEARLAATVEYLNGLGYMARWERHDDDDYLLLEETEQFHALTITAVVPYSPRYQRAIRLQGNTVISATGGGNKIVAGRHIALPFGIPTPRNK